MMINVKVQIEILYLHEAGLRGFSLCLIQNLQFVILMLYWCTKKPWKAMTLCKDIERIMLWRTTYIFYNSSSLIWPTLHTKRCKYFYTNPFVNSSGEIRMQIKYESCILYVAQGVGVESIHEWLNTTRVYIY